MSHDDIKAALESRTDLPWRPSHDGPVATRPSDTYDVLDNDGETVAASLFYLDAHLIANAPTWLAELLAENERLSVELERSREQYGYAVDRVQHHQERAEKAEQAIQRVRWQCDSWSHGNSWNKAARNAILRTLDGGAS